MSYIESSIIEFPRVYAVELYIDNKDDVKPKKRRRIVNEYTIRNIQLGVAKGEIPLNTVYFEYKNYRGKRWAVGINQDGSLTDDIHGMDISDDICIKIFNTQNQIPT